MSAISATPVSVNHEATIDAAFANKARINDEIDDVSSAIGANFKRQKVLRRKLSAMNRPGRKNCSSKKIAARSKMLALELRQLCAQIPRLEEAHDDLIDDHIENDKQLAGYYEEVNAMCSLRIAYPTWSEAELAAYREDQILTAMDDASREELARYRCYARQPTLEELREAEYREIRQEALALRELEDAQRAETERADQRSKDEMDSAVAKVNQDHEDLEQLIENKAAIVSKTVFAMMNYITLGRPEPLISFQSLGLFAEANAASVIANAADKCVASASNAVVMAQHRVMVPVGDVSGIDWRWTYDKAERKALNLEIVRQVRINEAQELRAEATRASQAYQDSLTQSGKVVSAEVTSLAVRGVLPLD